jgi:pyruvate/2-oxoglutarate dehydrogenase complex dihydrolipoamide acyltransferase (E2) component
MDQDFVMPSLGVEIEEGVVRQWLKAEGDSVAAGELIVVIGTTKLDMEVEAPFAGVIKKILVDVDDVASVGTPLAVLTTG